MPRLSRLSLMVALTCGAGSMMLADVSVTCAVNLAKGNVSNSDISVQCGLSEQQVAEIRAGQHKTIEGIEGVQATSDEILALLVDQAKEHLKNLSLSA